MRGSVPIEIPVPTGGWRTNVPAHQIAPNELRNGLNLLLDLDGLYAPRGGNQLLPVQPAFGTGRIVAGLSFTDQDDTDQIIIVTLEDVTNVSRWFRFDGVAWVEITGPALSQTPTTPVRLVQFGFFTPDPNTVEPSAVVYGINGTFNQPLERWVVGDIGRTVVNNTVPGGPGTIAAADMDVIFDRLVLVNVFHNGFHFPTEVDWSDVLDGGAFHPLAFNRVSGIGNLVAVRATSRTAGVVYGQTGAWSMTGQVSDDAGAFAFDKILTVTVGPINANALISIGGVHYYLGTDYHVWRCDGIGCERISPAIDAGIQPNAQALLGLAALDKQIPVTLFEESHQRVWFFVTKQGDEVSKYAIVYRLTDQNWEVPQQFTDGITAAFPTIEQFAPTWDNPGVHAMTTLTAPLAPGDSVIQVADTSLFPGGSFVAGTVQIGGASPVWSDGFPNRIPPGAEVVTYGLHSTTTLALCARGQFGSVAGAYPAGTPVWSLITWNDAGLVWPNWNAIPNQSTPAVYLGTSLGQLARMGNGSTDPGGKSIAYSARWGLIHSPDSTQELQIDTVDVAIQPIAGDNPEITAAMLNAAYDTNPVQIVDRVINATAPDAGSEDDPSNSTWIFPLPSNPVDNVPGSFLPGNYLDVQISGQSTNGGPRFAGTTLFAHIRKRPDQISGHKFLK